MSKKMIFSFFISSLVIIVGIGIISVRLNRQLYIDVLEATDDDELLEIEKGNWDLDYMQNTLDKVKSVDYDLEDILNGNIDLSEHKWDDDTSLVNLVNEPKFKILYCKAPFEIRLDFPKQTIVFSKGIFTDIFSKVKEINLVKTFEDIFLAIGN